MFEGFEHVQVPTSDPECTINLRYGGTGPPVLLLHGNPLPHVTWYLIAPRLARDFTVVCADRRGYVDSSKPRGKADHSNYTFRRMAQDPVEVMEQRTIGATLGDAAIEASSMVPGSEPARVIAELSAYWPMFASDQALAKFSKLREVGQPKGLPTMSPESRSQLTMTHSSGPAAITTHRARKALEKTLSTPPSVPCLLDCCGRIAIGRTGCGAVSVGSAA